MGLSPAVGRALYDSRMKIVVNGQEREIPDSASVADLVEALLLSSAACAVEVNQRLITKRDHPACTLKPGDTVEVVTLVGGG